MPHGAPAETKLTDFAGDIRTEGHHTSVARKRQERTVTLSFWSVMLSEAKHPGWEQGAPSGYERNLSFGSQVLRFAPDDKWPQRKFASLKRFVGAAGPSCDVNRFLESTIDAWAMLAF